MTVPMAQRAKVIHLVVRQVVVRERSFGARQNGLGERFVTHTSPYDRIQIGTTLFVGPHVRGG